MKFYKKTVISLMIAASLTACNDDKKDQPNKKEAVAVEAVAAPKAKESKQFAEMLAYVPADTSYLMANSVAIPDNVMALQLKRMQALVTALSTNIKSLTEAADKAATEVTKEKSDQASSKEAIEDTAKTAKKEPNPGDFIQALFQELSANLNKDGLAKLGLKPNGQSMIYGFNMLPVIRYELSSKDEFKALLSRAEKESNYKLEWEKCGDNDCLVSKEGKDLNTVAVFVKGHVAISFFSAENKQQVMDHLLGVKKPATAYKVADWNSFVKENNYKGYGEGFIKLDALTNKLESFILAQEKKKKGAEFDEQAFKGCFAVAKDHTKNMPELIFGMKEMNEKNVQYELVIKTSADVSTVLQGLPNKLTDLKQPSNPIFTLGLNMNMIKLRGALTQYINFVAKSGEDNKCAGIDPVALRKSIGGLSMAMSMGASQFKSIFVALDSIELDDAGKPKKVEAFGSIIADDPMALLQMLAMVNPQFATLNLPNDGKPVKLPEGVIPPNPIVPELSLSRKDKALNIFVGNDKMALSPISVNENTIFWNVTDSKRYYSLINKVAAKAPGASDPESKGMMEMMSALGEYSGVVSQQIGFDKRGIAFDYNINYK